MAAVKPHVRTNAYYDLQSAIVSALETVAKRNLIYTSCVNCLNFRERDEICILANMRPPARVIVFGCPQWEDIDQIPF
jgi:hypothetical protein